MIIMRAIDPDIAILLLPYFVEVDEKREEIGAMIYQMMTDVPGDICVLTAIDKDLGIHGFTVAFKRNDDVFIWQAYNDGKLTRNEVDGMLGSIIGWAKSNGFKKISAIPNRNPKLWKRRWGFRIGETEIFREI